MRRSSSRSTRRSEATSDAQLKAEETAKAVKDVAKSIREAAVSTREAVKAFSDSGAVMELADIY